MRAITRVDSRLALLTLFLCFVARRSEGASHEDVYEIRLLREENRQLKSQASRSDSPSRQLQREGGASANVVSAVELATGAPGHASRRALSHDEVRNVWLACEDWLDIEEWLDECIATAIRDASDADGDVAIPMPMGVSAIIARAAL